MRRVELRRSALTMMEGYSRKTIVAKEPEEYMKSRTRFVCRIRYPISNIDPFKEAIDPIARQNKGVLHDNVVSCCDY